MLQVYTGTGKGKTTAAIGAEGNHTVEVLLSNFGGLPAVYLQSDVCPSDSTWECDCFLGEIVPVGFHPHFDSAEQDPQ
ncbi:MAG: cob(I)yrinic acid a,c-diamide adenosyltransferase, partial [Phascolarctobacterium sp.]|nr:cob(I)yrinic acid a,c-diamide adenosyltransferase [Phascolarctobacterium sp.]